MLNSSIRNLGITLVIALILLPSGKLVAQTSTGTDPTGTTSSDPTDPTVVTGTNPEPGYVGMILAVLGLA